MIPDRATYKKIEWHFYHYTSLKEEAERIREEILQRANYAQDLSGVRGTRQGSPTERQALALERELAEKTAWVQVVEETVRHFQDTPLGKLFDIRYVKKHGWRTACEKLYIEKRTYYSWLHEIILFAAFKAVALNIMQL